MVPMAGIRYLKSVGVGERGGAQGREGSQAEHRSMCMTRRLREGKQAVLKMQRSVFIFQVCQSVTLPYLS